MTHQIRSEVPAQRRRRLSAVAGLTLGLIGSLWGLQSRSAETLVPPGADALAAAIAAASPGDTLVLQNGSYAGATVNKSLSIRPINAATLATVAGTSLTIDAAGGDVTIQGLDLVKELVVIRGADVKILENHLDRANINTSSYKTSEGDGKLAIIGNWLHNSGQIGDIYSDDAYVAGNTLDDGRIIARAPVWIVGNRISCPNACAQNQPVYIDSPGNVQIIGNRISHRPNGHYVAAILSAASYALIAGNIVALTRPAGFYARGIDSAASVSLVFNNILSFSGSGPSYSSTAILAEGQTQGNIILNWDGDVAISGSGADYNLCFGGPMSNCGAHALKVDPKFVDTTDFKLAAGSPAIDAGPDSPLRADLDRTRNDIGAYGGPWPISQYDAQRDPAYSGPYLYPLFDAARSLQDLSTLQVRALGVARFR